MGIVRRDHEAAGKRPRELSLRQRTCLTSREAGGDPAERVLQEGRSGALLRGAPHLLVVKDAAHGNALCRLRCDESQDRRVGALEVVEARRRQKAVLRPPDCSLLPVVQEQVHAAQVLFLFAGSLRHRTEEGLSFTAHTIKREQVFLRVIGKAFVHLAVHVDRHIRDQQKIPVHVHQPAVQAAVPLHDDPARRGQRPVEPGCEQHPAVFLHIQFDVDVLHPDLRVLLDLEGRRITVACHDLKPRRGAGIARVFLRQPEGDQGRAVPCDKITSARQKLPLRSFGKLQESGIFQHFRELPHGVERRRTLFNKAEEPLRFFPHCILHFSSVPDQKIFTCEMSGISVFFPETEPYIPTTHPNKTNSDSSDPRRPPSFRTRIRTCRTPRTIAWFR